MATNEERKKALAKGRLREALNPRLPLIGDSGPSYGFNVRFEKDRMTQGMTGRIPSTSGISGMAKYDPLYVYSPSDYPERPQRASDSTVFPQQSTLSSNLQLGGFSNPLEPTRPSAFTGSPQQYTGVLPSAPVPPSNLFSSALPRRETIVDTQTGRTQTSTFPTNFEAISREKENAPIVFPNGNVFTFNPFQQSKIGERDISGFSPYSPMVPSMGGLTQAPSMAPTTDAITAFGDPSKSTTLRVSGPAGFGSTTLTPEQQTARFRASQQAEQMGAAATASSRTPEQQQALLAQMRERGAALAAQQTETMKTFAESRGARFAPMPAPQGRFGQPLTGLFPQSKEAIAQRTEPRGMERLAAFPSAIGFTEMQKQQASAMPPQIRNQSLFGGMGYSSVFGGPQPTSSMVAAGPIEEQIRKRIFGTI